MGEGPKDSSPTCDLLKTPKILFMILQCLEKFLKIDCNKSLFKGTLSGVMHSYFACLESSTWVPKKSLKQFCELFRFYKDICEIYFVRVIVATLKNPATLFSLFIRGQCKIFLAKTLIHFQIVDICIQSFSMANTTVQIGNELPLKLSMQLYKKYLVCFPGKNKRLND